MLILTRKKEEEIKIGDEITVRVLGIQGGYVKLGIKAPKSTEVHREEIYKKIQNEICLDITENDKVECKKIKK